MLEPTNRRENRRRSRRLLLVSLGLVLWVAAGCSRQPTSDSRPVVVASVVPLAYFVDRLAQSSVRVETLIPPGATPHMHEPGMNQVRTIAGASLFVKVGHPRFPFEQQWVDRLVATNQTLRVVDGFFGVPRDDEDPHMWVAPRAIRVLVSNLARALTELVPREREAIRARAAAVLADVDRVDQEMKTALAGVRSRRFIVLHPAWGYLANEYGLVQVDIEQQARDPRSLSLVIARAKAEDVRVLFVQPQVSRKTADLIARDIGAVVEEIDPLAYDWVANMRHVLAAFRRALAS